MPDSLQNLGYKIRDNISTLSIFHFDFLDCTQVLSNKNRSRNIEQIFKNPLYVN